LTKVQLNFGLTLYLDRKFGLSFDQRNHFTFWLKSGQTEL